MKERITEFLIKEGISPAEFADKIGVQRSSVSHVLNGRNHPSASFIQKILEHYKTLNPRWLLLGEGTILSSNTPISTDPVSVY
jgi:transcriptional regulator with XRE-family HTH domain